MSDNFSGKALRLHGLVSGRVGSFDFVVSVFLVVGLFSISAEGIVFSFRVYSVVCMA